MALSLKKHDGKKAGKTTKVNEEVWTAEFNSDLVHQSLVRQHANQRVGTACTKTRAEVRGGGRKPWKQKGTGRARAGSRNSPLWRGGGVIFGPKPRSYSKKMNKKMRRRAFQATLAEQKDLVMIVADKAFDFNKTAEFLQLLDKLKIERSANTLLLSRYNESIHRSTRNLGQVTVVDPRNVGVHDLLKANHILVVESALEDLEKRATV